MSSNESVELAIFADGRLELDMSLDQYYALNQSTINIEGTTLSLLAESNPSQAYSLVRRMVGSIATNTTMVSLNEIPLADVSSDGKETTHATAFTTIMDRMPESYERRIEFSLGVRPSEADILLFGDSIGNRLSILDLVVERPDLSS